MQTKFDRFFSRHLLLFLASLVLLTSLACNDKTFDRAIETKTRVVTKSVNIDLDRAADILFVIDNSGSMAEEQENLARNASSSSASSPPNLCDGAGFASLRSYAQANQGLAENDWDPQYRAIKAECGFIELLQFYNNHFHIGVISTDMNNCDRPMSGASRASVPQLGCLQTSQQEPNLTVLTWETPDLANKFASIVRNLGTWGSPYEQGLRASEHFLTSGHSVADSSQCDLTRDCAGDLAAFLRSSTPNAAGDLVDSKLVVIYLSDEEDCSNDDSIDESVPGNTALCYSDPQVLVDTAHYVNFFQSLKSSPDLVLMGLIAGLYDDGTGLRASGCVEDSSGLASNACDPAQGNSVNTCAMCIDGNPVCTCHPAIDAADCQGVAQQATHCCQADPAERYLTVVNAMEQSAADTLCTESYKQTLIDIAGMVIPSATVSLTEAVTDPSRIVVKMSGPGRGDGVNWLNVPLYDEASDTPEEGGWALQNNNTQIRFYKDWLPQAGDRIQVQYLGDIAE